MNDNGFLKTPYVILRDERLTSTDKYVMSLIHHMDSLDPKPGCWMSNKKLSEFLKMSKDSVSAAIQKLDKIGLIEYTGKYGKRVLYSKLSCKSPEVSETCANTTHRNDRRVLPESTNEAPEISVTSTETSRINNKVNNIVSNKNNKKIKVDEKSSTRTLKLSEKERKPIRKKRRRKNKKLPIYEHDTEAYQLALEYWEAQLRYDPNVHPEMVANSEKEEGTLQKWAHQFNELLVAEDPPYEEVVRVVKYAVEDKYWPRARYSAGNIKQNYLAIRDTMKSRQAGTGGSRRGGRVEPLPEDPDEIFTNFVIDAWKQKIPMTDKSTFPNQNQMKHFINFTIRVLSLYKFENDKIRNSVAQELIDILLHYKVDEAWRVKGGILKPWMLASDAFWNEYYPQWQKNAGIPLDCLTCFRDKTVFKKMVDEENQLTKDIESNLEKQNPNPETKTVSDTDNPELDYMRNV